MNTLLLKLSQSLRTGMPQTMILAIIIALTWPPVRALFVGSDPTMGIIEPNIWLLIITALMGFLLLLSICWVLLKTAWKALGFPAFNRMVLRFHSLQLWQQLGFYLCSFGLLLISGTMCLIAVC